MAKEILDEIELHVSISAEAQLAEGEKPYYWAHAPQSMGTGWVVIATKSIFVERPTAEQMRPQQIAVFREEIQKTRAEAESRVRVLEEQLQNLLAIGNAVGVAASADSGDDFPF